MTGPKPSAPGLVMLHGFLGQARDWTPVAGFLGSDCRCIMPELPDARGMSQEGFVAYCEHAWQSLERDLPGNFMLLGYSLGGRIALQWAITHPGRICGLVLESAHPGLITPLERAERLRQDEAWARRLETQDLKRVLEDWYAQPVFADLDPARRAQMIARRLCVDAPRQAALMRAASLGSQPDLRRELSRLDMPLSYICGGKDQKFSALGEQLKGLCPAIELVKLDALGHNCHAQAPAAVADIVRRAIQRVPVSSSNSSDGT